MESLSIVSTVAVLVVSVVSAPLRAGRLTCEYSDSTPCSVRSRAMSEGYQRSVVHRGLRSLASWSTARPRFPRRVPRLLPVVPNLQV